MSEEISFPVTFQHDDKVLFKTHGVIEKLRGEPYDTATVYSSALDKLCTAVDTGKLSEDIWEVGNLVVIDYPDGTSRSFTDDEMGALLDEHYDLDKYHTSRESRIIISVEGGFTGGLIRDPVDRTLDNLNERDFKEVSKIVELLQTKGAKLKYDSGMGDFGYFVRAGDQSTDPKEMRMIFCGGSSSRTPVVVKMMEKILLKYPEHPTLNSRSLHFFGGSVHKFTK